MEFGIIEFDAQLSCAVFCPRYCRAFLSTRICVRAIGSVILTYAFLTGHRSLVMAQGLKTEMSTDPTDTEL